jgi:hypothetical protein
MGETMVVTMAITRLVFFSLILFAGSIWACEKCELPPWLQVNYEGEVDQLVDLFEQRFIRGETQLDRELEEQVSAVRKHLDDPSVQERLSYHEQAHMGDAEWKSALRDLLS